MSLSKECEDKIKSLREQNWGYWKIANELQLKRDQVRDYCRRHAVQLSGQRGEKPIKIRTCKQCGKAFTKTSEWNGLVYCSSKCSQDYENFRATQRRKAKTHICKRCGKEFIRTGSAVFCNDECRYITKECEYCGKQFKSLYTNAKNYCSIKCNADYQRKTHEEYYWEFSKIHKGEVVPITEYMGSMSDMTIYCLKCKQTTTRRANIFINNKRGCIHCGHQYSTGEAMVEDYLLSTGVKYIKQYQDNSLADKAPLRFDFAILNEDNKVDMLIEYNGRQHYEVVEQFGGMKEFNAQKMRDKLKREYAQENNIDLLVISHRDKNNLENILRGGIRYARHT